MKPRHTAMRGNLAGGKHGPPKTIGTAHNEEISPEPPAAEKSEEMEPKKIGPSATDTILTGAVPLITAVLGKVLGKKKSVNVSSTPRS